MFPKEDWPEGWISERRELFVVDFAEDRHLFKFQPSKVTITAQNRTPDGPKLRNVAQCCACRRIVEPDWGSLRLHAYKHIFLQIPFEAKGDIE